MPAVAEVQFKATNAQSVITAFNSIGTASTAAGTKIQQFTAGATTKVQQFTSSLNAIKSQGDPFANLTNNMNKFNTTATTVGQKLKNFGSQFGSSIASIGTLGGTILNLSRQYQDLGDSQIAVDKAQLKVSKTTEATATAQGKLNALTAKGITSGAEYNKALLDVNQAMEAQSLAEQMLTERQEDHQRAQENFWIGLVPTITSAGASVISVVKEIGGTGGLTGLVSKFKGVGEAAKGLGLTMKTALIGTGIGAAIAALGIALEAFANNWWGVRDAVNDMGIALGKALPGLQPVLTALGKVGEGIVSTFGAGGTVPTAMAESSLAITLYGETTTAALDKALKYTDFQKRLAEEQRKFDDIMMASRNTEERNAAIAAMEKLIAEGEKLVASETTAQSLARNGIKVYADKTGVIKENTTATSSLSTATDGLKTTTDGLTTATNNYVPAANSASTASSAISGTFATITSNVGTATTGIAGMNAQMNPFNATLTKTTQTGKGYNTELTALVSNAKSAATLQQQLTAALNKATGGFNKATSAANKYNSALNTNYRYAKSGTQPGTVVNLTGKGGNPRYVTYRGGKQIASGYGTAPPMTKVSQHGYQSTVHRPTMFLAGEGGRPEDVIVRPRGSVQRGGSGGGGFYGTVNVYVDGVLRPARYSMGARK